jgi:hypothetical protein
MAENIRYSANELLGSGTLQRSELFAPIRLPSGMFDSDYASLAEQSLDRITARNRKVASSLSDRLTQEKAIRSLEAQRSQDSALAELYKIKPYDEEFGQKMAEFLPLAEASPAIRAAVAAKYKEEDSYTNKLSNLTDALGQVEATPEETDSTYEFVTNLLKQNNSRGFNVAMANLTRRGINDKIKRDAVYRTSSRDTTEQKNLQDTEDNFTKILKNLSQVTPLKTPAQLLDWVEPEYKTVELGSNPSDEEIAQGRNYVFKPIVDEQGNEVSAQDLQNDFFEGVPGTYEVATSPNIFENNLTNKFVQEATGEIDDEDFKLDAVSIQNAAAESADAADFMSDTSLKEYLSSKAIAEDLSLKMDEAENRALVSEEKKRREAKATGYYENLQKIIKGRVDTESLLRSTKANKALQLLRLQRQQNEARRRSATETSSGIDLENAGRYLQSTGLFEGNLDVE